MTQVVRRGSDHPKISAVEVAVKYAQDVLSGTIVAGKLVKYAAKRFIEDLQNAPARRLHFEEASAQHVVDFFGFLKHSKGEWGNQVFKLEPWQVFVLANLFGWYRADSTRRFTEAYIEIARKNGKTTFLAGIGLYLLLMDDEPGAEVYSAATKKDQARILFDEAARMRKASPFLTGRIAAFGQKVVNQLYVEATASKFLPLSSEDNTLDGLNIHGGLIDELHAHPDRKLYDVLYEATKARRQPMMLSITTAGYDKGPTSICWNKRSLIESILCGVISNAADGFSGDNVFGFIACIDDEDDWADERNWPKANPNLEAGIVKIRGLREAAASAKADPTALNSFLRKHMNRWTSQDTKWMDPDKWAACNIAGPNSNPAKLREAALEALRGRKCFGGLDLSSKIDLASYVLVFPPMDKAADVRWHILGWHWVPELNVPDRVKKDRVPYDVWIRDGYLRTTDGNVVDQDVIQAAIELTKKDFQIEEVGYDSWNNSQLSVRLQAAGIKMTETRQGFKTFSEPMKETMALTLQKKFEHYGDPIMAWAMNNVAATTDPAGNIKPDKDKAKEKIDPAVALLMAMSRAIVSPALVENPYNSRGIIFI
jgi:phage terminase large subunit-like protein